MERIFDALYPSHLMISHPFSVNGEFELSEMSTTWMTRNGIYTDTVYTCLTKAHYTVPKPVYRKTPLLQEIYANRNTIF